MGERSITTQVKIDGQITPDFSRDWEVAFKGEKYIMPLRKPQGSKNNTSLDATINLTFHHWAEYQLKRLPFHTIQTTNTGTAIADKYQASVSLTLKDFCVMFGQVLNHNYGDSIRIDLNPDYDNEEVKTVSINNTYIWNVLTELYKIYGVRWEIVPHKDNLHVSGGEKYVIKVDYPTAEIDHIFEYGFEGGLLKIERQVQSEEIRNMLVGRGGSENMPKYYFKQCPETESDLFYTDPDWVPELANIYFDKLRGATFRSYIQGWKHKHYNGANKRDAAYSTWAYDKGYNDEKFDPVEFVKDEESIKSYGELFGFIEDKEDIYPSINLSELNHAIAVEQITTDDLSKSAEGSVRMANVGDAKATAKVQPAETYTLTIDGAEFSVGEDKTANLMPNPIILRITDESGELLATNHSSTATSTYAELSEATVKVYDIAGNEHTSVGLGAGTYTYKLIVDIHNLTTDTVLNVEVGTYNPKLMEGDATPEWLPTFQVWIPNLWGTQKDDAESDENYARRVWTKILGDRLGNEAKVMFTTGALATSEDYEFVITELPVYDTSKAHDGESSHWRLTLGKSDADYEATGLYVPSTMRQGVAGDKFVLLGIEPTQEYVEWAEKALDDAKTDDLNKTKDIQPTWSLTTDRVRLNNNGNAGALIDELQIGRTIKLADPRFVTMLNEQGVEVPSSAVSQYLQQIKYKFRQPTSEDAALNPDVELTLSNDYSVSANPVSTLQGDVEVLRQQIGSLSNLEKALRVIGDKLYLRKDGLKDRSYSPTEFNTLVSSTGFRNGIIGGQGWGFFKDANGSWVFETDKINVREDFQVNNLVVNQVMARGGMEIDCAAAIECTKVAHRGDLYYCYFDQKGGSVANLFRIDDVAYCHRWTAENNELKYYKRRVVEVGVDYIALKGEPQVAPRVILPEPELTDFGYTGNGKPEVGDTIVHFGNYTDKTRQYVKVRDVINGGYERFLDGLDSVLAKGTEYYFVGVQRGMYEDKPRFYIGNNDNFIEFLNGKLIVKGELSVESTIGDKTLGKVIADIADTSYLTKALAQNTTISGGLVLTSLVEVGASDGEVFTATAGMNGIMDSTHTNGGVVFWGGGTYEQAYNGASTYVIYADGTGHAAKGTIKFLENKLQVGQYVNLTNDGLDMTINGKRKMQMGNYETQPEFVMNHKKVIALLHADGDPLVSTSSLPLWRIASGTSYSAYVEGLGDPTNHKNFEVSIGSGIKGATLKFYLSININASIPTSFTSLNTSGLPAVNAWVIDTKTNASYELGEAKLSKDSEGRLVYSYRDKEVQLSHNHDELKLRVEIWNKIVLTDENKASGAWLQTETVNVNSGEFDTVEQTIPEYNQTTLGNNGLQVSWGNCHQYQKAGFWGVRVGELGLQVTDGNIKLRSRSMGGWVSLADYIKHVVSTMQKEGSEE